MEEPFIGKTTRPVHPQHIAFYFRGPVPAAAPFPASVALKCLCRSREPFLCTLPDLGYDLTFHSRRRRTSWRDKVLQPMVRQQCI